MEEGHLSLRVWCTFARAMGCGSFWVVVLNMISTVGYLASALWLGNWPEVHERLGTANALGIYAALAVSILLFTLLRILMFQWSSMKLATSMHKDGLLAVLRAPMSWLDTTPSGRIINRFSSDMSRIDLDLQGSMQNLLRAVCDLFASVMVAGVVLPIIFIIFVPILLAYYCIQKVYRKAGREIQRLASKARSPIYQGVDEAIVGVTTIRAYQKQEYFMNQNERRVTRSVRLDFTQMGCQKWLGFRLKLLGSMVSTLVAVMVVLHRYIGPFGRAISGPAAGLALRYAQQLSGAMEQILNNLTMAEQCLVAVERLNTYMEMENEGPWDTDFVDGSGWLTDGSVRFEDVVMRYRDGLPLVLKGLSFEIPGGSSLGIVGRTGAGKSSLLQVLFRMCPLERGAVYLDGHDISKMGLHNLRKSLAIIPQDPVGFTGTVKFNLDPFDQHSEDEIWHELEKVQLKPYFSEQDDKLEFLVAAGGENLSVGQRQLLCCARALMRGTRILVLDEATASVDFTTDSLIQNILQTEVKTKHLTTLTIAHRIQTVLGADNVLVVADGVAKEFGPTAQLRDDHRSNRLDWAEREKECSQECSPVMSSRSNRSLEVKKDAGRARRSCWHMLASMIACLRDLQEKDPGRDKRSRRPSQTAVPEKDSRERRRSGRETMGRSLAGLQRLAGAFASALRGPRPAAGHGQSGGGAAGRTTGGDAPRAPQGTVLDVAWEVTAPSQWQHHPERFQPEPHRAVADASWQ
eukprot:Skav235137  [mRNA]  locus=scaffold321:396055:409673:- [translate_table: standard]